MIKKYSLLLFVLIQVPLHAMEGGKPGKEEDIEMGTKTEQKEQPESKLRSFLRTCCCPSSKTVTQNIPRETLIQLMNIETHLNEMKWSVVAIPVSVTIGFLGVIILFATRAC